MPLTCDLKIALSMEGATLLFSVLKSLSKFLFVYHLYLVSAFLCLFIRILLLNSEFFLSIYLLLYCNLNLESLKLEY